jgi:ABC-2 type transport system ATP-binding protein
MTVIEVEAVRKSYGGRPVVDDVSLTVGEGEIFGILGPNGAGKTTLVECIEGLRRHDAGRIRVLGLDPHRDGAQLRHVLGVQLQASALQARITVAEALELYASFYDDPVDPGELLDRLGLAARRRTRYGALSGGLRQRLSIALALIGRPKVAVLDELTTGLDPQARRDTWELIEQVRDRGVTVVLVTHFMDEAERLCDRLAILDQGRVVGLDSLTGLVTTVSGEQRLHFVPSGPLDEQALLDLDEVVAVARDGRRIAVTGSGNVIQTVMVALDRQGIRPEGLRVEQQRLEDAFIALTGRRLDEHGDPEVSR